MERRLSAILYADVAGYSRLTGLDEEGTHRQLTAGLDTLSKRIETGGGRIVHYAGDAVLAEFGSVVAALESAIGAQEVIGQASREVPEDRRLRFRVGINLGEVMVDREEIYGDGVNIAARLESLAEPGGICISEEVYRQVRTRVGARFDDMGLQSMKNIAEPARSFHVRPGTAAIEPAPISPNPSLQPTIAIELFRFLGDPGSHGHLADALTETVISALAHFRRYHVVEGADLASVANADFSLAGTIQVAASRVRIAIQLSKTDSGRKLWSERFDRKLDDVFELQDEVSAIVASTPPSARLSGRRRPRRSRANPSRHSTPVTGVSEPSI